MRSSSHSGQSKRRIDRSQTTHTKCDRSNCPNGLYVVGIGPGDLAHLSQRACDVLKGCHTIVGYGTYIRLIESLTVGKEIISTGMTREVDRVSTAIEEAVKGKSVALVSSGDPGIYAMAGLALEICAARKISIIPARDACNDDVSEEEVLLLEVVPGIPALCSGAALLGAPLMHDFAAVSLSDLLTPWTLIEQRLHAVAKADFVMVIYNPKSKKRDWQLVEAQQIALAYRSEDTPVGIVTGAMRENQGITVTTLGELHNADVGMQSTVFIGNSTTTQYGEFLYTLRGYGKKYGL